jgi:hypothetical protein
MIPGSSHEIGRAEEQTENRRYVLCSKVMERRIGTGHRQYKAYRTHQTLKDSKCSGRN